MIKLYDTKLSGNAWKVRLVLRHLGLDFERETLSLPAGDQRTAAFTALNSFQRVPVLVMDDGTTLRESGAILLALAQGTRLMPESENLRQDVMAWMFFEQADLTRFLAYPRFFAMTGQVEAQADVVSHYHSLAHTGLQHVDNALADRIWITGDLLSVADFALYPYIKLGPEGGFDLSGYDNVRAWMDRFEKVEGFEPLVPEVEAVA